MTDVWPTDLPDRPESDGYSEKRPQVKKRTEMDAGPPKMRRAFTGGVTPIRCKIVLDEDQPEILREFHDVTLVGGTLEFEWVDFITGDFAIYRFVEEPTFRNVGGDMWEADLSLERMP